MADLLEPLRASLADRYLIERELGRGGMAIVYLAEDRRHQRRVALKVLRPELTASVTAERFLREIRIAAQLNHPHILPLHDSGEADGTLWYTMPYVDGESLRDRLNREEQLPIEDALQITREVADALGHAHAQGIVHRDIKPENILFQDGRAMVTDFGIARAVTEAGAETLTETGLAVGSPAYMSPEQGAGAAELDGRSDLYSLGCVLYELLTGETPYTGRTPQAILAKKLTDPLPPVSTVRDTVPVTVEAALTTALAKNAVDRYPTAAEFTAALTTSTPAVPRRKRHAPTVLAAVTAVVAAAVAGWQYRRAAADPGPPPADRPFTVLAAVEGSADSAARELVGFLVKTRIDESHVVQTLPQVAVERQLELMDRLAGTAVDRVTANEIAIRGGWSSVVVPRLDRLGDTYALTVRVEAPSTGELRAQATGQTEDPDAWMRLAESVVDELRRDLGERRELLAATAPLPDVLTPSLEALRKFRDGSALIGSPGRYDLSLMLLREAVELDPAFAKAWHAMGVLRSNMGQPDSALPLYRRSLRFPGRLDEPTRLDTRAEVLWLTDFSRWDEALRLRRNSVLAGFTGNNYAIDLAAAGLLDSAMNLQQGVFRDRIAREERLLLQPSTCADANHIAYALASGRMGDLVALLDSLGVQRSVLCRFRMDVRTAFAAGDFDRADSLVAGRPDLNLGTMWAVDARHLDAPRGRIASSHLAFSDPAAVEEGSSRAALILEVVYRIAPASGPEPRPMDRGLTSIEEHVIRGVRNALVGDSSEAKRVLATIRAMQDSATSDRFDRSYGPMLALMEAGPAARRGDWRAVADMLAPWGRRLREPGYGHWGGDTYLTWWVLSEAYANLGIPDSAIVYLESVVAPPRWQLNDWRWYGLPYPAAHFKLGQLYAQLGDREKSLEHNTTFLDVFADPDPEYAWMVAEARAEVGRLGRGR